MNSLDYASELYERSAHLDVRVHAVEDVELQALFDSLRTLRVALGELASAELERLVGLFRVLSWMTRSPVLPRETDVDFEQARTALDFTVQRVTLLRAAAAAAATTLRDGFVSLVSLDETPLHARFVELARENPGAVVLLSKSRMIGAVEQLLRSLGLEHRVVHARDPRRIPFALSAILVGPLDDYPSHVFLSPRIPVLQSLVHSWKQVAPLYPVLPGGHCGTSPLAGIRAPRVDPAIESNIDIEALTRRLREDELRDSDSPSAREKVQARLIRLAGDHFMFVEAGGKIRVFDILDAPSTSRDGPNRFRSSYVDVDALDPGMFVVERTRGATMALEDVGARLLGKEDEMKRLQASQQAWKRALRDLIRELGLVGLSQLLLKDGCASAHPYLLHNWGHDGTILPADKTCLRRILTLAGRSPSDIETAIAAGEAHRRLRIRAGMRISKLLAEKIKHSVDPDTLDETGTADVPLVEDDSRAPRMKMLRVEGTDADLEVMRGQLRIVFEGLSESERI